MLHDGARHQIGLRAAGPVEFITGDDGMVRLASSPGVVLATDIPVREYVPGVGYARVSLRMTKAMLARWRASGALDPDGNLLMSVGHAAKWNPNPAMSVGRWEKLRIEDRDGYKALVADPAFDPAAMAAWMRRASADAEAWMGMIARGTIARTSIGYSATVTRDQKDSTEPPLYIADPWQGQEASWVALGADAKAGANRAHEENSMNPEEIQAAIELAIRQALPQVLETLRQDATPVPAPEPAPSTPAAPSLDADPVWRQLQKVAADAFGAGALDAVNAAREAGTVPQCVAHLQATIADKLRDRTAGNETPPESTPAPVPVRHRIEDGDVNAYRALTELIDVYVARGMRDVDKGEEEDRKRPGTLAHARQAAIDAAYKIDRDWEVSDPRKSFVEFARAMGIVGNGWYSYSPREIMETLATGWSPTGREHVATMGGRWFGARDAAMTNGSLDVLGTMRHGAAGSLVPADLQAVFLAIVTKIFLLVHDSQTHMLEEWGRSVALGDLNVQTLIRHDLALSFDAAVSNQDLPEAFLFSEGTDIKTEARGVVWSYGWESMFTDGGQILVGTPALLAMRWMSAKIAHWFKKLQAGIYTPKGGAPIPIYSTYSAQGTTLTDIGQWLEGVCIAAGDNRPVAPPAILPKGLSLDKPMIGAMEPTLLLYGNRAMRRISDHFAARQPSQVNGTSQDRQLTDFEEKIGRNKVRTPYLEDDSMYALITSGPAAAMTAVGLDGRGMTVTSQADVNIRQLPSNVVRITDEFAAFVTHPHGAFRNALS